MEGETFSSNWQNVSSWGVKGIWADNWNSLANLESYLIVVSQSDQQQATLLYQEATLCYRSATYNQFLQT